MSSLKKVLRYITIYGFSRTLYKVIGRTRFSFFFSVFSLFQFRKKYKVGFIGAGQFPLATIGFFVKKSSSYSFDFVYDIDPRASESFARLYGVSHIVDSYAHFKLPKVDLVYIASNHYSHCQYAIDCINAGISVHIEKPIAVNWEQFYKLGSSIANSSSKVFVGYNRPFSAAIEKIKLLNKNVFSPFSLSCFVVGHYLNSEHWYRDPEEGTRICGNLGHWLDLTMHLLCNSNLPESIAIDISYSNLDSPDDDITVVLTTKSGDLATLTLTSRSEPFEGINETISFHQHDLIATISDFRSAKFWKGESYFSEQYFPKDVGHKKAILQHLNSADYHRNIDEIRLSTALMLEVKDMVIDKVKMRDFHLNSPKYKWF